MQPEYAIKINGGMGPQVEILFEDMLAVLAMLVVKGNEHML